MVWSSSNIDSLPLDILLIIIQFVDPASFAYVSCLINKKLYDRFATLLTRNLKWSLSFLRVSSLHSDRIGRGIIHKYRRLIENDLLNVQHIELGVCGQGFFSTLNYLKPNTLSLDFSRDTKHHLSNFLSKWFDSSNDKLVKLKILSVTLKRKIAGHNHVRQETWTFLKNLTQLREVTLYYTKMYCYSLIVNNLPESMTRIVLYSGDEEDSFPQYSCYDCSLSSLARFRNIEVLDLHLHGFGFSTLYEIGSFPRLRAMRLVEAGGKCLRAAEFCLRPWKVVFPNLEELVLEGPLPIDDILQSSGKNIRYLTILPPLNGKVDVAFIKVLISTKSKLTHLTCPISLVPRDDGTGRSFLLLAIGSERLRRIPNQDRIWHYV